MERYWSMFMVIETRLTILGRSIIAVLTSPRTLRSKRRFSLKAMRSPALLGKKMVGTSTMRRKTQKISPFSSEPTSPSLTIQFSWHSQSEHFVAFKSVEQFGGIYDGALCSCAGGAGATRIWDNGVPALLAYDILFGIPGTWGTVGEVRNDIDFETEVQPKLIGEVSNPLNFPKFEFIRLVAGVPGRGITPPAPPAFYSGWVMSDMFFLTEARAELQRRAGGPFVQNLDQNYSLAPAEKAYLMGFGIPGAVIDGWLAQMNARRNIQAAPNARNYVAHNNDYNGKLKHPV